MCHDRFNPVCLVVGSSIQQLSFNDDSQPFVYQALLATLLHQIECKWVLVQVMQRVPIVTSGDVGAYGSCVKVREVIELLFGVVSMVVLASHGLVY